ncbi:hypothetical protein ENUP19_0380G0055 [Entamoeba nuttalli]|uniref:BRCA1 C Terminus (BRCT) domain containing protein n=2 Tax=Entamoeba nuttalli TaxID=412467 RepID=K2HQB0_ENTNP|nr:BRCA1 C Terminus (BRCT) domain containing protein [Entamoeba nuttalli P19]EKE38090.1 BRCA1 C Terminus (BRCT) domain containing protein [Entamoeba nuttalli P19]|eukprot:XP_008859583.1 BRCA1 C Terminus (BRCT) domain containing protein [Entamoeba nuttalli P19]
MEITSLLDEMNKVGDSTIGALKEDKKNVPILSTEEARKKSIDLKEQKEKKQNEENREKKSSHTKKPIKKLLKSSSSKEENDNKSKKPKSTSSDTKDEKKKTIKKKVTKEEKEEKEKKRKDMKKEKKITTKSKKEKKEKTEENEDENEDEKKELKRKRTTKVESSEKSHEEKKPRKSDKRTKIILSGFDVEHDPFVEEIKTSPFFSVQKTMDDIKLVFVHKSMRTEKVLDAIVKGIPVVNEQYLEECEKENREVEIDPYLLTEAFPGLLVTSQERKNLFKELSICICGQPKILATTLSAWIERLGGKITIRPKDADVIICGQLKHHLTLREKKNDNVQIVAEKWLYDSIGSMKVMDYKTYKIDVEAIQPENDE